MTANEIFNKLFNGGNIKLPYLVKFTKGETEICLINDNVSVVFNGDEFQISSFDYMQPNNTGDGGSLSITADDENKLLEFVVNGDDTCRLDVVGILEEGSTVQQIHSYKHFLGTVSYSENKSMEFQLANDRRNEYQFPPYKYDTDNNRANA